MPSKAYVDVQNKLYELYHGIGQLSPKRLNKLEKEVRALTPKNAWWLAHRAQSMLLEAIRQAKALNKLKKKGKVKRNVSTTAGK